MQLFQQTLLISIFYCVGFSDVGFPVVGLSDDGNANNVKKGKARLSVPCPLSSISCRGGCYHPDLKSSKQVVHLQVDLLKVQIYQPFSRTGCVLPWQTNRIFVIDVKLRIRILFFSIAHIVHKVESHFKMRIPIDSALKLLL